MNKHLNGYKKKAVLCGVMVFGFWAVGGTLAHANEMKVQEMLKKAKYVGMDTCITCHDKEGKEYKLSTHYRVFVKNDSTAAQGCETCHGPGSIHVDNGGGKGSIVNPKKDPEICFTCHTDKRMQFRLPYRHPVLEGKMSCSDCHDAHGMDARPWTTTSENAVNEACFKCHTDKRGPYIWGHDALKEGCTTCHQVHGSVNDKMLVARDYTLCLRCHATAVYSTVGVFNHGGTTGIWTLGTCWSGGCHQGVHGSNFNNHLRY